jgi:S1-C subfamily serine protease
MDRSVLEQIRAGICAVGFSTLKLEEIPKNPTSPFFKVLGTGFLVRQGTVLTNRHVILELNKAQKEQGFPKDQRCLQFLYSRDDGTWTQSFRIWSSCGVSVTEDVDAGFIEFKDDQTIAKGCKPLVLGDLSTVVLGEAVATCGYPYGDAMFQRGPTRKIYRFGPVLQQGWISAIAPFDDRGRRVDELLLDIRVAGGMSGSPVFRPGDGSVVGMIYASWEATTAVAVPIDAKRVALWLQMSEEARKKGPGTIVSRPVEW